MFGGLLVSSGDGINCYFICFAVFRKKLAFPNYTGIWPSANFKGNLETGLFPPKPFCVIFQRISCLNDIFSVADATNHVSI